MEHDRGRLRDGGVCGGGPRGEDLRPRAAQRRARHKAAGCVCRGLAGKYHEIIISIMLQMEMAFLVSIHILCRTFQTKRSIFQRTLSQQEKYHIFRKQTIFMITLQYHFKSFILHAAGS